MYHIDLFEIYPLQNVVSKMIISGLPRLRVSVDAQPNREKMCGYV